MTISIRLSILLPCLLVTASAMAEVDTGIVAPGKSETSALARSSDARERGLNALRAEDYLGAAAEFQEAAGQGDAEAMRHLGDMAFAGMGVAQSYDQAIHWYCQAALAADKDSLARLQTIDLMSWSTERNAQGWQAACEQWLKPSSPPVEPQTGPPPPEVNINITVQPERERNASSLVWPGYVPKHWRRMDPGHRPRKPEPPPLAPYGRDSIGR